MPQQNIENDDKIGHRTKSKEYSWVNSTRDLKLYLTIDGMLAAMKIIVIMSMLEPQLSSLRLCRLIFKAAGSRFTVLLQRCFCFFFSFFARVCVYVFVVVAAAAPRSSHFRFWFLTALLLYTSIFYAMPANMCLHVSSLWWMCFGCGWKAHTNKQTHTTDANCLD